MKISINNFFSDNILPNIIEEKTYENEILYHLIGNKEVGYIKRQIVSDDIEIFKVSLSLDNNVKIKTTIWNNCFIFRIIESGFLKIIENNETFTLSEDSVFLSHYKKKVTEIIEFVKNINHEYLVLVISNTYLETISNSYIFKKMISQLSGNYTTHQNNILNNIPKNTKEIIKLITLYEKHQNKDLLIYAKIHELIYLLSISFTSRDQTERMDNFLTEVKSIIDEQYNDPKLLELLPQMFFVNKVDFGKKFKNLVGMGTHEYIKKIRMEKAHSLIIDNKKKIFEISEEVGYKSYGYFSKIFYEHFGVFPKDVKKTDL